MTIRAVVLCDSCDAVFVPEGRQPHRGLSELAHAEGWTSTRSDGRWLNECPDHTHDE